MSQTSGMMTHRELLADPIYRKWFSTPPDPPPYVKWRVYVQKKRDKRWRRRDFDTWAEAYKFFRANYKKWYNAALISRNWESRPPVVKYHGKRQYYKKVVLVESHRWCGYCRRPTMFGFFTRHHAFPKGGISPVPYFRRCGICGMREENLKSFH